MVIDMNEVQVRTVEQVRQVVAGTQALQFQRALDDTGQGPGHIVFLTNPMFVPSTNQNSPS